MNLTGARSGALVPGLGGGRETESRALGQNAALGGMAGGAVAGSGWVQDGNVAPPEGPDGPDSARDNPAAVPPGPVGPPPPPATFSPPDIEAASRITGVKNDSLQGKTFNTFWGDMNNRYAVFQDRLPAGKTWADLGREYGQGINGKTGDQQLFDKMLNMTKNLQDGHTSIQAPNLDLDEEAQNPYPNEDALEKLQDNVAKNYVDGGKLKSLANGAISYGKIGDKGYINISTFEGLTNGGDEPAERAAARDAMKQVMSELKDSKEMIVDVRSNGGGSDEVAKEIASWFQGPEALAWTKSHREGAGSSTSEKEVVPASGVDAFQGPTTVLQSGGSFSAAETFGMAMRTRDNVAFAGEPTQGHYSDVYGFEGEVSSGNAKDGVLPNGWTYGFSGERYVSGDGKIREGIGIPVDHEVKLDAKALERGKDNMLEAVLNGFC